MLSISKRGRSGTDSWLTASWVNATVVHPKLRPLWDKLLYDAEIDAWHMAKDSRWNTVHMRSQEYMIPPQSLQTELTRIALGLRLWLRRAIKRINERTMMRIVDMVNYDSLRALYKPIRIVELD